MNRQSRIVCILSLAISLSPTWILGLEEPETIKGLLPALTFYASFDHGSDADFARGDRRIYTASSVERKDPQPGLPSDDFVIARGQGRQGGDALRFSKKSSRVAFYKASKNCDYQKTNWSGTISFWLNLDPQSDLGDWYCDPLQITQKAWNDGAIWVDFSKDEKPKHFRLGAFADLNVWNPQNRDFEKMKPEERPMVVVTRPPFARGQWTHVALTFERWNTGKADGVARLYLNGVDQGAVEGRNQTLTWDPEKAAIQIGIQYVGLFDDLALFNRTLSAREIQSLTQFKGRLIEPKGRSNEN